LRIAFSLRTATGVELHPDCVAAVKDAAALCEDLGHELVEASPPINGEQLTDAFIAMWEAGTAQGIDSLAPLLGKTPTPDEFEPLTWALYEAGQKVTAPRYLMGITLLQQMSRPSPTDAGLRRLADADAGRPPPAGELDTPDNPARGSRAAKYVPSPRSKTLPASPAMACPVLEQGRPPRRRPLHRALRR
jgi:amidase